MTNLSLIPLVSKLKWRALKSIPRHTKWLALPGLTASPVPAYLMESNVVILSPSRLGKQLRIIYCNTSQPLDLVLERFTMKNGSVKTKRWFFYLSLLPLLSSLHKVFINCLWFSSSFWNGFSLWFRHLQYKTHSLKYQSFLTYLAYLRVMCQFLTVSWLQRLRKAHYCWINIFGYWKIALKPCVNIWAIMAHLSSPVSIRWRSSLRSLVAQHRFSSYWNFVHIIAM